MGIFDDLPELIAETLADLHDNEGLGFEVTLTSVTGGEYDPATGSTAPTTETQTVLAFEDDFSSSDVISGLVLANDKAIAIPGALLTTDPQPADTVTLDDGVYTIVRLRGIKPGAATVMHRLHLRRG